MILTRQQKLFRGNGSAPNARAIADGVITALSPAAWYRNATDVVSSGGFASIWADYASSDKGLVLPGVAGNYASTPDSAPLSFTGDFDLRVFVKLPDYTPTTACQLMSKWTAGQQSFYLYLQATQLSLAWTEDGSTTKSANSTAAVPDADGTGVWIRATLDVDNGSAGRSIKFYSSADGSVWTQIGSTVTQAGVTSVFNGTAALGICAGSAGAEPATGLLYRAIIYSDLTETTKVFDADFSAQAIGAGSFTESSSNAATVTINTSGARPAHIGKARDLLQGTGTNQPAYAAGVFTFDGADNFMATGATVINQPVSIYLVFQQASWTLNDVICDGGSTYQVYIFQNAVSPAIRAGAGSDIAANTNLAVGSYGIVCAVINGATSSTRVNNTAKVTGAAGAGNYSAIRLGASGGGTAASANILTKEFIIFPAAHDDATQSSVITALNNALTVF